MISKIALILTALITVTCAMQEPATPAASFEVTNDGCKAPCQVAFKDMTTNKGVYNWKYDWSFKDSTQFSTEQDPVLTFVKAGKYRVMLTIGNDKYGSSSMEDTITITGLIAPKAEFTVTGNNCQAPCEVSFTNLSTNAKSYKWEFGDSSTVNTEQSPRHTFSKAGTFKVLLTVLNEAVADTASTVLTILTTVRPVADFDIALKDSSRADSMVFSFVNKSKHAAAYLWDFGDKMQTATTSPTQAYVRANNDIIYTVSLSAILGNQVNKKTKTLTVLKK